MTTDIQPSVSFEQYQQLEKQYRKLLQAVESSPATVIITSPRGEIEYTNPKFTEITGYSEAEVIGKNPRILNSGQTPPEVFREMWQTIRSGQQWHGELINRKKDGSCYHEFAAIAPVFDGDGKIINYVAIKIDISAQKTAEMEKERIHNFLQMVIDAVPEGIMVIGPEHRIKLMNQTIRESIGPGRDSSDLRCYQASHQQDTPCSGEMQPCPLLAAAESRNKVRFLHQHRSASGETRYIELIAVPLFTAEGVFDGIIESGRDVTERKLSEEKLEHLAHYDSLTNIPNRVVFFDVLQQKIDSAASKGTKVAVLYLDLDGFKAVNDSFGHEIGDMLLQNAAKRLCSCIRSGDTVARMGGDEFAVILAPLKARQDALKVAGKIQHSLGQVFRLGDHHCAIGASVGISYFPDDGNSPEELIRRADENMYLDKRDRKRRR